jgi:hypothetical protein
MKGLARDGRSRRLFALAIEAEWRKRAASVVPAQPKARPEGRRPIGVPLQTFPPPRKLDERIAAACSTILRQERYQADQKDLASVDRSHEAAVVLEPANRISAETPTSAPPMMQNICRQIADGIASWVTPWTSA